MMKKDLLLLLAFSSVVLFQCLVLSQAQATCSAPLFRYDYSLIVNQKETHYFSLGTFFQGSNLTYQTEGQAIQGLTIKQAVESTGASSISGSSAVISTSSNLLPNGNINYGILNNPDLGLYSLSFSNVSNATITPSFDSYVSLNTTNNLICYSVEYFPFLYGTPLAAVVDCQFTN